MREPCDESLKSVRKGDMQLPRKNLPDRASSVKFLRLKRSWLRTLALILSEVRSHWRILSDGTVIGLCLIKQPWVLCGEQF